jgi:hypothetical protein
MVSPAQAVETVRAAKGLVIIDRDYMTVYTSGLVRFINLMISRQPDIKRLAAPNFFTFG